MQTNNQFNPAMMMQMAAMSQMNPMAQVGQFGQFPGMPAPNFNTFGLQGGMRPPGADSEYTLWVGGLSPIMQDTRLHAVFQTFGHVKNCRVMYDSYEVPRKSRGFGFVTFSSRTQAQNALEALRYTIHDNYVMQVNWKGQSPKTFESGANLCVRGLDKNVTEKDLHAKMQDFGKVISVCIRRRSSGESLGYGYVQFERKIDAEACLQNAETIKLGESTLDIAQFLPKSKRGGNSKANLYIRDFKDSIDTEEKVRTFLNTTFGEYGNIKSLFIKLDEKKSKYFAFVCFEEVQSAEKAKEELHGHDFDGVQLLVAFAQTQEQRRKALATEAAKTQNQNNLIVKSIKIDVTKEQFEAVFSKYGAISSAALKEHKFKNGDGERLLQGFVCFINEEDAKNTISKGKEDPEILALISPSHKTGVQFINIHQSKAMREKFNKMNRLNTKTISMMDSNSKHMNNRHQKKGGNQKNPAFLMQQQVEFMQRMFMMQQQNMMANNPMMKAMQNAGAMNQQFQQIPQFQQQPQQVQAPSQQQPNYDLEWVKKNLQSFMGYNDNLKKNILGNLMFPKVERQSDKNNAPKITGMLIDLDVLTIDEIIETLEDENLLAERIAEAKNIIEEEAAQA